MNTYAFTSIQSLKDALTKKTLSSKELLELSYTRFNQYDSLLGSSLEIFEEDTVDKRTSVGLLGSIPGLIKDNISQKGRLLTCGSKILQGYKATFDATVTQRLQAAGAVIIGRANMDEFAMGSTTETSAYKKTLNPWDQSRVPGGSSGGSAAAVAAGLVSWALGSDTGGSVRQPAGFCGIVGMKPTYGLVSRFGLVAYASSLDQIGPLTRTVYDNALVLSAIAGHDSHDSTTHVRSSEDYTTNLTGSLPEGFTLGVIDNALEAPGFDYEVYEALNKSLHEFERLGARIKRIKIPVMDQRDTMASAYFMISRAEAASNLARFDGVRYGYRSEQSQTLNDMYQNSRNQGFGLEVKSRILIGNYVLSAGHADEFYKSAKIVQAYMREELLKAFKEVDLLFMPTAPASAFPFGAYYDNPIQVDLQDYFTAPANITGIPALAVPCGFTSANLPISFQLMGPDFSEAALYQAAYAYEQATPWHTMHPPLYKG
ncbi:Asp-tRNA(Asn)/Glu-tRNA(Gln) amidotransferase subunit GatA [Candidatus Dependentiae bacterium]|nr:Asp-tRNA(Asn)/Glu-tRNA(Gln) amidotransferase subunit GatA [Candidatus Dependentiae bacterium]